MRSLRFQRRFGLILGGAVLLQFGGCLGPNPGFFIGTSVANATISTLVGTFLNSLFDLFGQLVAA